jgi:hypothetical protein
MKHLILASVWALSLVCGGAVLPQSGSRVEQDKQKGRADRGEAEAKTEGAKNNTPKSKGKVLLQVIIRPSGEVDVVKVLEVTPKDLPKEVADELVKKSIEAARGVKVKPLMKDGRPVAQRAKFEYNFTDEEEKGESKKKADN